MNHQREADKNLDYARAALKGEGKVAGFTKRELLFHRIAFFFIAVSMLAVLCAAGISIVWLIAVLIEMLGVLL